MAGGPNATLSSLLFTDPDRKHSERLPCKPRDPGWRHCTEDKWGAGEASLAQAHWGQRLIPDVPSVSSLIISWALDSHWKISVTSKQYSHCKVRPQDLSARSQMHPPRKMPQISDSPPPHHHPPNRPEQKKLYCRAKKREWVAHAEKHMTPKQMLS